MAIHPADESWLTRRFADISKEISNLKTMARRPHSHRLYELSDADSMRHIQTGQLAVWNGGWKPTDRLVLILFPFASNPTTPLAAGTSIDVPVGIDLEVVDAIGSLSPDDVGSTDSEWEVFADAASIGTVTLPSGDDSVLEALTVTSVSAITGKLRVECTTAGTGAQGGSVLLRARATA